MIMKFKESLLFRNHFLLGITSFKESLPLESCEKFLFTEKL